MAKTTFVVRCTIEELADIDVRARKAKVSRQVHVHDVLWPPDRPARRREALVGAPPGEVATQGVPRAKPRAPEPRAQSKRRTVKTGVQPLPGEREVDPRFKAQPGTKP